MLKFWDVANQLIDKSDYYQIFLEQKHDILLSISWKMMCTQATRKYRKSENSRNLNILLTKKLECYNDFFWFLSDRSKCKKPGEWDRTAARPSSNFLDEVERSIMNWLIFSNRLKTIVMKNISEIEWRC